jgi:hypothetical protein
VNLDCGVFVRLCVNSVADPGCLSGPRKPQDPGSRVDKTRGKKSNGSRIRIRNTVCEY